MPRIEPSDLALYRSQFDDLVHKATTKGVTRTETEDLFQLAGYLLDALQAEQAFAADLLAANKRLVEA